MFRSAARNFLNPIPASMRARHRTLPGAKMERLRESIAHNYHRGWRARESYSAEAYERDLRQHLSGRLEKDRRVVLPWLQAARPLDGLRILEIGAGTGSSTVALAEQGARVIGIDIDEDALAVARDRLEVYGLEADLRNMNVTQAATAFAADPPDMVIFFACLEHMTVAERLEALPAMWSLLPRGGQLVVVETPNRLWYTDPHTSLLPFFHWLPDDLAFNYSRFSPREVFKDRYRELTPKAAEDFARQGRGVSYHEFDATLGRAESLRVVSSLSSFRGWRYHLRRPQRDRQFSGFLRALRPDLHEGFVQPWLDLILTRD
jgi:S-adenosylmethionine-dependent methyltransferase